MSEQNEEPVVTVQGDEVVVKVIGYRFTRNIRTKVLVRVDHGDEYLLDLVASVRRDPDKEPPDRQVYLRGDLGDDVLDAEELRALAQGMGDAAKWLEGGGPQFLGMRPLIGTIEAP